MSPPPDNSLLRNLGQFVGHIADAIKSDPTADTSSASTSATPPVIVRTKVEEHEHPTPEGKLILRRTTIDEIEVRADEPAP